MTPTERRPLVLFGPVAADGRWQPGLTETEVTGSFLTDINYRESILEQRPWYVMIQVADVAELKRPEVVELLTKSGGPEYTILCAEDPKMDAYYAHPA